MTRLPARLAALLFAAVLAASGCSDEVSWTAVDRLIESRFPGVGQISTDSLAQRLSESPPPVLLDVRAEEEFQVSRLPGAVRIDPDLDDFSELDSLRNREIVTYCSVGYRSAELTERLQRAGFSNVRNLRGSIFKWANEGRPVYRNGQEVSEVHAYDRIWGKLLHEELRAYEPRVE